MSFCRKLLHFVNLQDNYFNIYDMKSSRPSWPLNLHQSKCREKPKIQSKAILALTHLCIFRLRYWRTSYNRNTDQFFPLYSTTLIKMFYYESHKQRSSLLHWHFKENGTYIMVCGEYSIRQVVEGEVRLWIHFNEGHVVVPVQLTDTDTQSNWDTKTVSTAINTSRCLTLYRPAYLCSANQCAACSVLPHSEK